MDNQAEKKISNSVRDLQDTDLSQDEAQSTQETSEFVSSIMPTKSYVDDPDATRIQDNQVSQRDSRMEIPGYKILGELGRGGMGVVYKARQELADRVVALKLMLNAEHAGESEISRFKVEAQASARLHHPNIVQVHDVNQVGDLPYFTLEYVEGGTLAKRLTKQTLSIQDAAKMMLTLAEATAYAHSRGVVHRDLKPANILLTSQGVPKIADFGLARKTDDISHLTIDGTILGTPSYMSPEQARGDQSQIGPLSDLYSLGAILYELLTGRPPFKASSAWDVINQVRTVEPTPPSLLEPKTPRDLETICIKCLQKSPDKRYGSTQLLAEDLRRFLNNEPISARPIGSIERFIRLCKRYPREARLAGIVAGLLMIMTIGSTLAAYYFNQQRIEIKVAKSISDQRLTTYKTTVSPMVNSIPQLIETAPLASGLRDELMIQLQKVFEQSVDTGAVGPSRQWGLEAIMIRRGDLLLSQADEARKLSDQAELALEKLKLAAVQFEEAIKIAQGVYDSQPEDVAKATSNLAHPISRLATVKRMENAALADIVALHQRAIELRREALAAEKKSDLQSLAIRQSELGIELLRYSEFLLDSETDDPKRFATRANELSTEASGLLRKAMESLPIDEPARTTSRREFAIACALVARSAERIAEFGLASDSFRECILVLDQLCKEFPNRYVYRKDFIAYSNAYADYLMRQHADPALIAEHFSNAMSGLKQILDSTDLRMLRDGPNGLANQFYRLGIVEALRGNPDHAKTYFERCALMRELAWQARLDEISVSTGLDSAITQRIEVMIAQARCGKTESAIQHAQWLYNRADELAKGNETQVAKTGGFQARNLYLFAASGFALASAHLNGLEHDQQIQLALGAVRRAVDTGFRDKAYLANDPDFSQLQPLEDFQQLISAL